MSAEEGDILHLGKSLKSSVSDDHSSSSHLLKEGAHGQLSTAC